LLKNRVNITRLPLCDLSQRGFFNTKIRSNCYW